MQPRLAAKNCSLFETASTNKTMKPLNRRHFITRSAFGSALAGSGFFFHPIQRALAAPAPGSKNAEPLSLTTRQRVEASPGTGNYQITERQVQWNPRETAVIVVDMWDKHWCNGATSRVAEIAPRMNTFIHAARDRGVFVIHAPSSCMDAYKDHPGRKRAQNAPRATNLPPEIGEWCNKIPSEENGKYPIDQSDGGCDCEPKCEGGSPWRREVAAIEILDIDAISDSGVEIWNLLEEQGIKNVMIFGVHTNMCVLGRPFGLRQMSKNGKHAVLVRDLTDTMYNHKAWPYVNHFKGTELIVEHIEKFVCPTITSESLLGKPPFRFSADPRVPTATKL